MVNLYGTERSVLYFQANCVRVWETGIGRGPFATFRLARKGRLFFLFAHSHKGLKQGLTSASPAPTQIVSNEEFLPIPQTIYQRHVDSVSETLTTRLGSQLRRRNIGARQVSPYTCDGQENESGI